MTNEEAIKWLNVERQLIVEVPQDNSKELKEAYDMAIKALEQESITWIVGKDNCQVAVRNMPIDKMQKICAIIGEEEQQPSDDCISREEAISLVHELAQPCDDSLDWDISADEMIDGIKSLPSVTPKPKSGKWIDIGATHSQCDKCLAVFEIVSVNGEANYCPNCGAKMEVEE